MSITDLLPLMVPTGLFVFVVIIATLLAFLLAKQGRLPYEKQARLFTPAEQHFLRTLDRALPEGYRLFGKVRIADVLQVSTTNQKRFWRYFVKISSKHIDYVIVDAQSMAPVAGIELDDSSHDRKDRRERDEFVNKACAAAQFPLIRVPARRQYATDEIRALIEVALNLTAPQEKNGQK